MPEGVLALFIFETIERYGSIFVDGAVQFYCFTIYTARDDVASESR